MAKKEEEKSYALLFLLMSIALFGVGIWCVCNEISIRRPWKGYQKKYFALEKEFLENKLARLKSEFESQPVQEKYMEAKNRLDEAKGALNSPNNKRYYEGLLDQKRLLEEEQLPPLMFEVTAARSKLIEQKYIYSKDNNEETLKKIHELEDKIGKLESRIDATKQRRAELQKQIAELTSDIIKFSKELSVFFEDIDKVEYELASVKQKRTSLQAYQVYFEDINEADRCMACHLGINKLESVSDEQPYSVHPDRELYLGNHPPERFGCVLCHRGQGRATTSPEKAHGDVEYWLTPVLRGGEAHTSCIKCHHAENNLPGAAIASKGKKLFRDLGCYGCHTMKGFEKYEIEAIGPDLLEMPKKVSEEWLVEWMRDPRTFRPDTRMPEYNFSEEEAVAIAAYLWQNTSTVPLPLQIGEDAEGDVEEGRFLFENVGCLACHNDGEKGSGFASNLYSIGNKIKYDYLVNWLVDPKLMQPKTKMPNLMLTKEEGINLATYLTSLKEGGISESPAEIREAVNDPEKAKKGKNLIERYGCFGCHQIAGMLDKAKIGVELSTIGSKPLGQFDFGVNEKEILHKVGLHHVEENTFRARKAWIAEKLRDSRQFEKGKYVTPEDRLRMPNFLLKPNEIEALTVFLIGATDEELPRELWYFMSEKKKAFEEGQELIEKYNCTGCHMIAPDRITLKDNTRLVGTIKLKEGDNIFFQLLEDCPTLEKKVGDSVNISTTEIKEHIHAVGGDINPLIISQLVDGEGMFPEEAKVYIPPHLYKEGKKVQPQWLFDFFLKPYELRPWLDVVMPTYEMSSQEATTLAKYFSLIENEDYPFLEINEIEKKYLQAKEKKFPNYLAQAKTLYEAKDVNCGSCHIQGGKTPEGDPSEWAPDLSLARKRLRPAWITKWLLDPQSIQPGTKMPKFFRPGELQEYFPGTPEEQAIAIKDLLMNFSTVFSSTEVAWTEY